MEKIKDLNESLHNCCVELKKLRKKYASKRSGYITLPYMILRKKYKLYIPLKYMSGKKPDLVEAIYLLTQRAYLMGQLKEIRGQNNERNN